MYINTILHADIWLKGYLPTTFLWWPNWAHFCACQKSGSGFPTWYILVFFMFHGLRWEMVVHFVGPCADGIVDYHCLNFIFIKSFHLDTLSQFWANQSLFLLLNDACLEEKQQIPNLESMICPVCLMVFNDTFNNISVILWRPVLLVEESRVVAKYELKSSCLMEPEKLVFFCKSRDTSTERKKWYSPTLILAFNL